MRRIGLYIVIMFISLSARLQGQTTEAPLPADSAQWECDLDLAWYDLITRWQEGSATNIATCEYSPTDLSDSVLIRRLYTIPSYISLPYNSHVRNAIEVYVNHRRGLLSRVMSAAGYYFPIFEQKLSAYNLPLELRYLPVIESGLNSTALSRVGAAGLWQFMVLTGRSYGLEINSLVDERCDPYKATDAACRFLRDLFSIYGDWHLAIAAYNCGPGNVNKAIARSGGKRTFWDIYDFLPRETRSYLPLFIAATYSLNYADEYGIKPALQHEQIKADTVITSERIHFLQISTALNIGIETIRQLNPQYRRDIIPGGKPYPVCLPVERLSDFIALSDSITKLSSDSLIAQQTKLSIEGGNNYHGAGQRTTHYKVKKGDTLGYIAKKFHCTVKQLQKWNNLKTTNLRIGQSLRIMH